MINIGTGLQKQLYQILIQRIENKSTQIKLEPFLQSKNRLFSSPSEPNKIGRMKSRLTAKSPKHKFLDKVTTFSPLTSRTRNKPKPFSSPYVQSKSKLLFIIKKVFKFLLL